MKSCIFNTRVLGSALSVVALAAPALAGEVDVVATGSVTSVSGPGLTDPVLAQLAQGQSVEWGFRTSDIGTATGPNGLAYSVANIGSRIVSGASMVGAVHAPGLNQLEIIDEPSTGVDSLTASMELPGQATALLQITNGSGSLISNNAITSLIGIGFVPFGGTSMTGQISDGVSTVSFSFVLVAFTDYDGPIGANYCTANPNSTGAVASITVEGSGQAAENDLTLRASGLPVDAFGFFITSRMQGVVLNPGGSDGNLCVTGSIGRYVGPGQIQQADASGAMSLTIDVTQMPQPIGFVAAVAGDNWSFQTWYRDSSPAGATSNFTNGFELAFN